MDLKYPVKLETDTDGSVLVSFPDVPEAHTFGEDKAEALLRAVDALETALEFYVDDGSDIPTPSRPKRGQEPVSPNPQTCIKLAIYMAMREQHVRKSDMAARLQWHMPQVDRVLDIRHNTKLASLQAAAQALGKRIEVSVR